MSDLYLSLLLGLGSTGLGDRKSTRLNSSHTVISYAVFCLKKKYKCKDQNVGPDCNAEVLMLEGPHDAFFGTLSLIRSDNDALLNIDNRAKVQYSDPIYIS